MPETVTLTFDPNLAICPPDAGLCPGSVCSRPICGYSRVGECVGAQCQVWHEYPPIVAYDRFIEVLTQGLKEANLQEIQESGWKPDWRFWAGLTMAGAGGYIFWKSKGKRR